MTMMMMTDGDGGGVFQVWDEKLARVAAKWTRHCTSGHDENRKEPGKIAQLPPAKKH